MSRASALIREDPILSFIRDADRPFDDPRADVILRSSDGVDFRVFKTVLSLASPLFNDMFSLPQRSPYSNPQQQSDRVQYRDGLLVIPFTEDSQTLEFILRSCYPIRSPKISELTDLSKVLSASRKYQIDVFDGVAESMLDATIPEDPFGVYAIAVRFGLHDIADKAARRTVRKPLLTFSKPLLELSVDQYYRLLKYRDDCSIAAVAVTKTTDWFEPCFDSLAGTDPCNSSQSCYVRRKDSRWYAPPFVWEFFSRAATGLKDRPFGSWLTDDSEWECMIVRWKYAKCNHLGYDPNDGPYNGELSNGMDKFRRIFAAEVETAVDAVSVLSSQPCGDPILSSSVIRRSR